MGLPRVVPLANGLIAAAKFFGGFVSGSVAMLAEGGHSTVQTGNQFMLLLSLGMGRREPRPSRPFGHGKERFFWTFMVAVIMFVGGAIFALGYGIVRLLSDKHHEGGVAIALIVLGFAFVAETVSFVRAMRQARDDAKGAGLSLGAYFRSSRDPTARTVVYEDTAALIGLLLAAGGVILSSVTGSKIWDAGAAILIGLLLMSVGGFIGAGMKHLLIGAAARPDEREALETAIEEHDEVVEVVELLTMALGPNALLVAARIDLQDDLNAERVEELATDIDERLRDVVPDVTEVFLDATPGRHEGRRRGATA